MLYLKHKLISYSKMNRQIQNTRIYMKINLYPKGINNLVTYFLLCCYSIDNFSYLFK